MVYGDTQHLCHLQSTIVEIPLLVGVVLACYFWTARRRDLWPGVAAHGTGIPAGYRNRDGLSYLVALDFFPHALLSPAAKRRQAELDKLRETDHRPQSPETKIPKATP